MIATTQRLIVHLVWTMEVLMISHLSFISSKRLVARLTTKLSRFENRPSSKLRVKYQHEHMKIGGFQTRLQRDVRRDPNANELHKR